MLVGMDPVWRRLRIHRHVGKRAVVVRWIRLSRRRRPQHGARVREGETDADGHDEREVQQSPRASDVAVEIPDRRAVEKYDGDGREEEDGNVEEESVEVALIVPDE